MAELVLAKLTVAGAELAGEPRCMIQFPFHRNGRKRSFIPNAISLFLSCGMVSSKIPVRTICKDFGVICIHREGKDVGKLITNSDILQECRDNIISVDEIVPNQISSSRVRDCVKRCLSIKYLTCDEVIEYIREHKLFREAEDGDTRL